SYSIGPAALGEAGRTVRCSRCKETWLARPEDAIEFAMAETSAADEAAEWGQASQRGEADGYAPHVDSPSISGGWQGSAEDQDLAGWPADARDDLDNARPGRFSWLGKLVPTAAISRLPKAPVGLTTACAAMGALV